MAPRSHITYQPALDGLRGVAVIAVLLFHGDVWWAAGGYLGVSSFFTLSGFLITTLILTEHRDSGTVSLKSFWSRRFRRLMPAAWAALALVLVYGAVAADASQLARLRGDVVAALGYVANWRFIFNGESYADLFADPSPVTHFWSLAIEEQFYFMFPLAMAGLLVWRRTSLGWLAVATAGAAAASAAWMAVLYDPGVDISRVYYGTDTRIFELLVGVALSLALFGAGPIRSIRLRHVLAAAAVAVAGAQLLAASTVTQTTPGLYRGGFLLYALGTAVIVTSVVQPQRGPVGEALSIRPLRWVGRVSYGVYLYHWPIYLWLDAERTGLDGWQLLAVRMAVTFALATASFYLLEWPIRHGALSGWRPAVLAPITATALIAGVVLVTADQPEPSPLDVAIGEELTLSEPPPPPPDPAPPPPTDTVTTTALDEPDTGPERLLIVGDSVSVAVAEGLFRYGAATGDLVVDVHARAGCGFVRGEQMLVGDQVWDISEGCNAWPQQWGDKVAEFQPSVAGLLAGSWDITDHRVDGRWLEFGTPEMDRYLLAELGAVVELLGSTGARVVLITSPLGQGTDGERNEHYNELLRLYGANAGIDVYELDRYANPTGSYTAVVDGIDMRADGAHFSDAGADYVAEWLAPQIIQG